MNNSCPMCASRGKTWSGSDPNCAFVSGTFSPDNWNCATANAIRDLFPEEWSDEAPLPFSFSRRYEDQNAAVIHVAELEDAVGFAEILFVGWYKSRGRTEQMLLLGDCEAPRPPTLAECEAIISYFTEIKEQQNDQRKV